MKVQDSKYKFRKLNYKGMDGILVPQSVTLDDKVECILVDSATKEIILPLRVTIEKWFSLPIEEIESTKLEYEINKNKRNLFKSI